MKSTADQAIPAPCAAVRLIVCDLDGTLLRDDQTISEYTMDIFAQVRERGMIICMASGRANQMMTIFREPVMPCDFQIAFNGGTVEDVRQDAVIYKRGIDRIAARLILAYAAHHHLILTMYSGDTMYYTRDEEQLLRRIANYEKKSAQFGAETKINAIGVSFAEYASVSAHKDLIKVVIYENDPVKTHQFNQYVATIPSVCTESTGYGMTGIFDRSVSKGTALAWLGSRLGIHQSEICAFGDFDNDLSLFDAAGLNVAVENATDLIKSRASFLTESNNQDGVARFIEMTLLKND